MTSTTANPPAGRGQETPVQQLLQAGLENLAATASKKVDDWVDRLDDVAANGGPIEQAAVAGVQASTLGKNPVWAAVKGAWSGASGKVRLVVVLTLVLALVLAPVVLVLLLLGLLVAGVVAGVRAAAR